MYEKAWSYVVFFSKKADRTAFLTGRSEQNSFTVGNIFTVFILIFSIVLGLNFYRIVQENVS